MSSDASLSAPIESLPSELLYYLASFIPSSSTSIRPRTTLAALSLSSRHFYTLLSPLVNERVELHSEDEANRFFQALGRASPLRRSIRSIKLLRPTHSLGEPSRRRKDSWNVDTLKEIVRLSFDPELSELTEIGWTGVSVTSAFEALLSFKVEADDVPQSQRSLLAFGINFQRGNDDGHDTTAEVVSVAPVQPSEEKDPSSPKRKIATLDATTRHQHLLDSILDIWPNLRSLSISNLPESRTSPPSSRPASPSPQSGHTAVPPSTLLLTCLNLRESYVTPEAFNSLLSRCSATMEKLEVVNCRKLSSEDLVRNISQCRQLRSLTLQVESAPTDDNATVCLPPSPVKARKGHAVNERAVLETLLPSLPHLKHLTAQGDSLFSSSFPSFLIASTPHLQTLSLSLPSTFDLAPSSFLPLIKCPSSSVHRLQINDGWKEPFLHEQVRVLWGAAVDRDIIVEGNVWDQPVAKWVDWAEEGMKGLEVREREPGRTERKRPKSRKTV